MDDRASLTTTTTFRPLSARVRGPWLEGILGSGWKIACFFVLPMVLIMVGLIF